jgi:hypothetical protein
MDTSTRPMALAVAMTTHMTMAMMTTVIISTTKTDLAATTIIPKIINRYEFDYKEKIFSILPYHYGRWVYPIFFFGRDDFFFKHHDFHVWRLIASNMPKST